MSSVMTQSRWKPPSLTLFILFDKTPRDLVAPEQTMRGWIASPEFVLFGWCEHPILVPVKTRGFHLVHFPLKNLLLSAIRMDAGLIFSQISRTASVRSLKSKRKVFEFFAFRALVTHIVFLYVFSCFFLFSYLVICFNCIYIFYGIIFFNCFCISKYFRNYPCFRMIIF